MVARYTLPVRSHRATAVIAVVGFKSVLVRHALKNVLSLPPSLGLSSEQWIVRDSQGAGRRALELLGARQGGATGSRRVAGLELWIETPGLHCCPG